MNGFGLAHVKAEGQPAHPEDVFIHCGCEKCESKFKRQAKAYFDSRRQAGAREKELSRESYYEPPNT